MSLSGHEAHQRLITTKPASARGLDKSSIVWALHGLPRKSPIQQSVQKSQQESHPAMCAEFWGFEVLAACLKLCAEVPYAPLRGLQAVLTSLCRSLAACFTSPCFTPFHSHTGRIQKKSRKSPGHALHRSVQPSQQHAPHHSVFSPSHPHKEDVKEGVRCTLNSLCKSPRSSSTLCPHSRRRAPYE